jgi:hypothetical protein
MLFAHFYKSLGLKKSNVRMLSNVRPQKTTFAKNLNNLSVKAH